MEQNIQEDIEKQLELVYESNKDQATTKELVVYVQPFHNGDKLATYVYAKNFHTEWEFNGQVRVATYNDSDEVVHDELLEVQLELGETKLVHREFGDSAFKWFRYEFYPGER